MADLVLRRCGSWSCWRPHLRCDELICRFIMAYGTNFAGTDYVSTALRHPRSPLLRTSVLSVDTFTDIHSTCVSQTWTLMGTVTTDSK
jgi:hypothetical protein